jgi:hypothetical protein
MSVTLGGIVLTGVAPIDWASKRGVDPATTKILCERNSGLKIFALAANGPMDLVLGSRVIKNLYVTRKTAGVNADTISLEIQDVRWLWRRNEIPRSYNLRQRTGENFLKGDGSLEVKVLVPGVKYKPFSLMNNTTAWTLRDALDDIMADLNQVISIPVLDREIELEDYDEIATHDEHMRLLLSLTSGYTVIVDDDGGVAIVDELSGEEAAEVEKPGHVIRNSGWVEMSDNRYVRPAYVDVAFLPECELKFIYDADPASTTVINGREPRTLVAVMPVPDKQLTVNGRDLAEGSIISQEDFYSAVAGTEPVRSGKFGNLKGALSDQVIRETILRSWQLKNYYMVNGLTGDPEPLWVKRIQTVLRHWRKTFQVVKEWRDRIREFRAIRVGVVDDFNRARASARAYTDYTEFPARRMLNQRNSSQRRRRGWITLGYNDDLGLASEAPSDINIKDSDNGVIRVFIETDFEGTTTRVIPGVPVNGKLPFIIDDGKPVGLFALLKAGVTIDKAWKLAVVLTCIKAGPNNSSRMYRVRVKPDDVKGLLKKDIPNALGPPLTVYVQESPTTTARFSYTDDLQEVLRDTIDNFFFDGTDPVDLADVERVVAGDRMTRLLNNKEHIAAMAKAAAAKVYSTYVDRPEGTFSFAQVPGRQFPRVAGSIDTVRTNVSPDGVITNSMFLPRKVTAKSFFAFLPPNVRKSIRGTFLP